MRLFLLRYKTLHFSLLNFTRLLPDCFSSLLRSLIKAVQACGVSATSPSFVSSANLLRAYSVPPSTSLMQTTDQTYSWLLVYTIRCLLPTGLFATDHYSLDPFHHPVFHPPHSLLIDPIFLHLGSSTGSVLLAVAFVLTAVTITVFLLMLFLNLKC